MLKNLKQKKQSSQLVPVTPSVTSHNGYQPAAPICLKHDGHRVQQSSTVKKIQQWQCLSRYKISIGKWKMKLAYAGNAEKVCVNVGNPNQDNFYL